MRQLVKRYSLCVCIAKFLISLSRVEQSGVESSRVGGFKYFKRMLADENHQSIPFYMYRNLWVRATQMIAVIVFTFLPFIFLIIRFRSNNMWCFCCRISYNDAVRKLFAQNISVGFFVVKTFELCYYWMQRANDKLLYWIMLGLRVNTWSNGNFCVNSLLLNKLLDLIDSKMLICGLSAKDIPLNR